jgi:hypothetical protein
MGLKMAAKDFVKLNDQGDADITLSKPLKIGGVDVPALRMREPTVNDQLIADAMTGTDADKELAMFGNLTSQAPDDIKRLTMRDYKRVQAAYGLFID